MHWRGTKVRSSPPEAQDRASYQVELTMSALGQKQTFAPQNVMSALPPKADIDGWPDTVSAVRIVKRGRQLKPNQLNE
jgi:hypothetical protein